MADDLTIALKPTSTPLADAEREPRSGRPRLRPVTSPTTWSRSLWTEGRGWHDAQLVPYAPLSLDPATMALHYGQAIFEGLKAYRQPDGSIATFRPEQNARRFQRSARRLAMPELPEELFLGRDRGAGRAGRGLGAGRRRAQPVPAAVHVLHRGRPRRASGRRPTCSCSSRRRPARTSRAGSSRCRSGCPRSTCGRRPAAPARPSAPATTRPR